MTAQRTLFENEVGFEKGMRVIASPEAVSCNVLKSGDTGVVAGDPRDARYVRVLKDGRKCPSSYASRFWNPTKTFDLPKAKKLRDAGKDRAATERRELLEYAQTLAGFMARRGGTVTADDVYMKMIDLRQYPERLGNAWGSVFADKTVWEWTGEWRQSTRVSNRGRYIRVWRLKKS